MAIYADHDHLRYVLLAYIFHKVSCILQRGGAVRVRACVRMCMCVFSLSRHSLAFLASNIAYVVIALWRRRRKLGGGSVPEIKMIHQTTARCLLGSAVYEFPLHRNIDVCLLK